MAQKKTKTTKATKATKAAAIQQSMDGVFLLKLMLYVIVGSLWLKPFDSGGILFPLGLAIGLLFAVHDHFQIDRKIEFAVLIVATMIGFVAPYGLYVSF